MEEIDEVLYHSTFEMKRFLFMLSRCNRWEKRDWSEPAVAFTLSLTEQDCFDAWRNVVRHRYQEVTANNCGACKFVRDIRHDPMDFMCWDRKSSFK